MALLSSDKITDDAQIQTQSAQPPAGRWARLEQGISCRNKVQRFIRSDFFFMDFKAKVSSRVFPLKPQQIMDDGRQLICQ